MIIDRFSETSIFDQNNMTQILVYLNPDNLVIGGTCTFAFSFDNFSESMLANIQDIAVIYKEGINIKFIKHQPDLDIELHGIQLLIKSTLASYETSQFHFGRSACTQVRFTLFDGTVLYGELIDLVVTPTIDTIKEQ